MLLSALVNASTFAAQLVLLSISLSLIYGLLRLPNFAQGEFGSIAAYAMYAAKTALDLPLLPAALLGIAAAAGAGLLMDALVFRRLRQAPVLTLMIVSFGLAIVVQNVLRAGFGPDHVNVVSAAPVIHHLGPVIVTETQALVLGAAVLAVIALHLLVFHSRLGRGLRAVAADAALARARAIDPEKIIRFGWVVSGALAGLGGILAGLDIGIWPSAGSDLMLHAFAVVAIGGPGNIYCVVLGAILLALAENLLLAIDFAALVGVESGALFLPTGYKSALMFVVLVIALLILSRFGAVRQG